MTPEQWKLDVMRQAGAPGEPVRADFGSRVPRCSPACPYLEEQKGVRSLGFCRLFGIEQSLHHCCEPVICAMSMRLEQALTIDELIDRRLARGLELRDPRDRRPGGCRARTYSRPRSPKETMKQTNIRIAIAGASGTGKTTLARALSERYLLPVNPVGSRSVVAAMGLQSPYEVDRLGRRGEFQGTLFQAKRAWEESHDSFVTDRSTLDNLAYCLLHMSDRVTEGMLEEHAQAMKRYDVVFMLWQSDFIDLNDPARAKSPVYHWAYERLLLGLFEKTGTPRVDLNGSREIRLAEAFRKVGEVIAERKPEIDPKVASARILIAAAGEILGRIKIRTHVVLLRELATKSAQACSLFDLPRLYSTRLDECRAHYADAEYNLSALNNYLGPAALYSEAYGLSSELHALAERMLAIVVELTEATR